MKKIKYSDKELKNPNTINRVKYENENINKTEYTNKELKNPNTINRVKYKNENINKTEYTNKEFKRLSTMDMLNKMIEIQMLKINNNNQNKITKENELAMQNMIELLKLRYNIIHHTK